MGVDLREKTALCYNSALSKKAIDPVALDVRGISSVADVFIIVSGSSSRHVQTIADAVEDTLRDAGEKSYHIEGYKSARWVLIDAGDVVIHIFQDEAREYYQLERLWADAASYDVGNAAQVHKD